MLPEVFLDAAKDWAENRGDCEAHVRSSISRAYYAAFHRCKIALDELNIPEEDHLPSHQRVIQALKRSGDKELSALGRKLADLKIMRESADYEISHPLPSQNQTVAIRKAETIFDRCNEKAQSDVGT